MLKDRKLDLRLSSADLEAIQRDAHAAQRSTSDYIVRSLVPPRDRTAGRVIADMWRTARNTNGDRNDRVRDYLRSVDAQSIADNLGVVPEPLAGPLVNFVAAARPVGTASNGRRGPLSLPAGGREFTRSRVTQRTTVAEQSTEHTQLSSRKLTVAGDTVTKHTYGGVVDISEQDVDWTDGAIVDDVLEDLAAGYGEETEAALCADIEAAATATEDLSLTADSDALFAALAAATLGVYGASKRVPDAFLVSVDRWAYLISLMDDVGRSVLPDIPLPIIVSPAFSDGFWCLASMTYVESYEQDKGRLTAPIPSFMELYVAYRGYFATNVRAEGLVAFAPGS